jgi:hypothetical protein
MNLEAAMADQRLMERIYATADAAEDAEPGSRSIVRAGD